MYKKSLAITLLIVAALSLTGCAFLPGGFPGSSGSTTGTTSTVASGEVKINEARMCTDPEGKRCPRDQEVFSPGDPSISFTAVITNVEKGLPAEITWRYLGGDPEVAPFVIDSASITAEETQAERPIISTISKNDPSKDWASGDYEVLVRLPTVGEELRTTFKVKASSGA